MKALFASFLCVLTLTAALHSHAKAKPKNPPPHIARELEKRQTSSQENSATYQGHGLDVELIDAVNDRRRVGFVKASGLLVIKILPDDTQGREHQKWVVQLSNGKQVQAVYNSDMCPRVPLKEGDIVEMGGEFIWTPQGGLLHWLHHDPRGNRPDGYVILDGTVYCGE